jgi:O-antigen ligase
MVLTLSRAAIVCFGVTLALIGAAILSKGAHRTRRGTLALSVLMGAGLLVVWSVGVSRIAERFSVQPSLEGRLDAWRIAARMVREFPMTGTGVNSFDSAVTFFEPRPGTHWNAAHNDYLQLLVEGGLMVALPFLAIVVMAIRQLRDRFRHDMDDETFWLRAGAAAGIGGMALQESVDFSLQLPGIAALFALLCAVALHSPRGMGVREEGFGR